MEQIHKERLLALADFLEKRVHPDRFALDSFIELDEHIYYSYKGSRSGAAFKAWRESLLEEDIKHPEDPECGSTCCALGWCPNVFPGDWMWVEAYDVPKLSAMGLQKLSESDTNRAGEYASAVHAQCWFGISCRMTQKLFFGADSRTLADEVEMLRAAANGELN